MTQPITTTRITIDFRDSIHPDRGWILGVGDGRSRVELLAFDGHQPEDTSTARALAGALIQAGCTCPDFCERDHANE